MSRRNEWRDTAERVTTVYHVEQQATVLHLSLAGNLSAAVKLWGEQRCSEECAAMQVGRRKAVYIRVVCHGNILVAAYAGCAMWQYEGSSTCTIVAAPVLQVVQ